MQEWGRGDTSSYVLEPPSPRPEYKQFEKSKQKTKEEK